MFDDELSELLTAGHVLVARVGYRDRFELKARADAEVERIGHDEWVQLVASRDAREVVVRIEEPGVSSPRVVVLARDASIAPRVLVRCGPLYLGGPFRIVETIDAPEAAEARWRATQLPSCWVSTPAPSCC